MSITKPIILDETGQAIAEGLMDVAGVLLGNRAQRNLSRVIPLSETPLAYGTVVEAVGVPIYLEEADLAQYADYGLDESGWYVFARIVAREGTVVDADTEVDGAAGVRADIGADHIDVAIRFGVTAESQRVVVRWSDYRDVLVFKATDLAIRNLDYRTTFYVYDIAPFARWTYGLTADATFTEGKNYYVQDGEGYALAEVTAGEAVPAYYVLGQDGETYERATGVAAEGVTYYTLTDSVYTPAELTAGEAIPVYWEHTKLTFEGMTRNVTYRFNELVDCPQEYILPEIDDDVHGCWYEIRLRHGGSYSSTLIPPSADIKVGTAQTQSQTEGINVIDLQYSDVCGMQLWTLLNTHSNLPA